MKLIDRIAPAVETLSLAGLGASLAWVALSGRYGSFVPPSARLGIIASGVGLLACALAMSSRLGTGEDSPTSRKGLTRGLVALLAALILILPFRVSPSELAATTMSARAANAEDEAVADPANTPEQSPSPSPTDGDGGTQGQAPDGSQSGGAAQASARGQAAIPRLAQGDSFAVARMAIWCCAADAYAIGFVVRSQEAAPPADTWVRVSGTLRLRGTKALVIDADSVEVTSAPDPEFVLQTR